MESYCLMDAEFQFYQKKSYGDECGDAYTPVLIDITPVNCTLRMVKIVSFM